MMALLTKHPLARPLCKPRGRHVSRIRPTKPPENLPAKQEPITPEVLQPRHPPARTKDSRGKLWVKRFITDRTLAESIEFLKNVRDSKIQFEDVRVTKNGEIVRFRREPSGELRQDAAKWLAGHRIPAPLPEPTGAGGAKAVIVIIHPDEPEI